MTFGQRIEHIWEYYRLPVLAIIAGIFIIGFFIFRAFNNEPYTLVSAVFVGGDEVQGQESTIFKDFIEVNGYDSVNEEVSATWSGEIDMENGSKGFNEYQLLSALFLSGDIDLLIASEDVAFAFSVNNALADLTKVLPDELLDKYKDNLVYSVDLETEIKYPCGIMIPSENRIYKENIFSEDVCISIAKNSINTEEAILLMEYLLEN